MEKSVFRQTSRSSEPQQGISPSIWSSGIQRNQQRDRVMAKRTWTDVVVGDPCFNELLPV